MKSFKSIFSFFVLMSCTCFVSGQDLEVPKQKKFSADVVLSGGSSSIISEGNRGYNSLTNIGEFKNKPAYYFDFGVDFKMKMRRNSLKTGVHIGSWGYGVEGYRYIYPTNFSESIMII